MNMAKLQEILSLIASVGVIASIIFLGIEMQQNKGAFLGLISC
jgi:hypothetical protein